jgi:hypothetical protein
MRYDLMASIFNFASLQVTYDDPQQKCYYPLPRKCGELENNSKLISCNCAVKEDFHDFNPSLEGGL